MTTEQFETPPDVVADGASDVLAEDEVVHVPAAAAEMAESLEHPHADFVADVAGWDDEDPLPSA
jgi:hypothetical protein